MNAYYLTTILSNWDSGSLPLIGLGVTTMVAIILYSKERRHIIWIISKCAITLSLMGALPLTINSIGIPLVSRDHELIVFMSLASTVISGLIGLVLTISGLLGIKTRTDSRPPSYRQEKGPQTENRQVNTEFNMNNNQRENNPINEDMVTVEISNNMLTDIDIQNAETMEAINQNNQLPETSRGKFQESLQTITQFAPKVTTTGKGTFPARNSTVINDYPLLVVNGGPDSGKSILVKQSEAYIGRSADCDLHVDDKTMSKSHAIIKKNNDRYFLYDPGSKAGIYVNDVKVPRKSLTEKSIVKVGETQFRIIDVIDKNGTVVSTNPNTHKMLVVTSGTDRGETFLLSDGANTIGRASTCNVYLSDPTISRKQCSININSARGMTVIADLGGKTSTRVDDAVLSGLELNNGDVINMGKTSVMFLMTSKFED